MEFFTIVRFQARQGSKIWNRACDAWRKIVGNVRKVAPTNLEEVLSESFWWSEFSGQIGPGFSRIRASQLHKAGLHTVGDVWKGDHFLTWDELTIQFGFREEELGAWEATIRSLQRIWGMWLTSIQPTPSPGEWVGCFGLDTPTQETNGEPLFVFQAQPSMHITIGGPTQRWLLPWDIKVIEVHKISGNLSIWNPATRFQEEENRNFTIDGCFHRVRVIRIHRGQRNCESLLYYGRTDRLQWDPTL